MKKDKPHCFYVENILVLLYCNFGAQFFKYSYVLSRKELWRQKLNWFEETKPHINFEKLAFVKSTMIFNL